MVKRLSILTLSASLLACIVFQIGCGSSKQETAALSDEQVENIVERSYQYVAMYNVNNKFAQKMGGWNVCFADTQLKDHTMREIARPNNDTLYIGCQLDLRQDAMILEMPAFDSEYVSLMAAGYDHYVNIPKSTRKGDFKKPEKILFYTERTEGYKGQPVEGVDEVFEATGDFINVTLRIMPHASDPQRFQRIVNQVKSVKPAFNAAGSPVVVCKKPTAQNRSRLPLDAGANLSVIQTLATATVGLLRVRVRRMHQDGNLGKEILDV